MKRVILSSIFAICIVISFTSCDKWWKKIGGGGYTERLASMTIKEDLRSSGGTPAGYGVLMVYFQELCIEKDEKVSVYVDDMLIGNISKAAGSRKPPYGEQSESCITCPLEIGYHSISLKIGKEVMNGDPILIEQDYCLRLVNNIVCAE